MSALIPLAILPPAFAAFIAPILGRTRSWKASAIAAIIGSVASLTSCTAILYLAITLRTTLTYAFGGWPPPVGIIYEVDAASAVMGLLASALCFLAVIYTLDYEVKDKDIFFTLLLTLQAGLIGICFTGDAFNLFVMMEVAALSSYALVAFERRKRALLAALKYLVAGATATTLYLAAVSVAYWSTGVLAMAGIAALLRGSRFPLALPAPNMFLVTVFVALAFWALSLKSALFPLHFWLPDAHSEAPAPVSALLSGAVVSVFFFALLRITYTVAGSLEVVESFVYPMLIALGAAGAILGSCMMLMQRDVKRLIAYSTVLHMSLAAMAAGLGTIEGLEAALAHLVLHGVCKALLFLSVGLMAVKAGSTLLEDVASAGRYMPKTALLAVIAAAGLVGLPPLGCFASKLLIYNALVDAGLSPLAIIVVATSALALLSYLRLLYAAIAKPAKPWEGISDAGPAALTAMVILAVGVAVLGVVAFILVPGVIRPAASALLSPEKYIESCLKVAELLKRLVKP